MSDFYYVAKGLNGVVITDSLEQATVCKEYLQGRPRIKMFTSFGDAHRYARLTLKKICPFPLNVPDRIPLGKIITRRKIMIQMGILADHDYSV